MIRIIALLLSLLVSSCFLVSTSSAMELETGLLLIAEEEMKDPRFRNHTVLLLQHDARGSVGLILDRESRLPLTGVLGEDSPLVGDKKLAYGGPVEPKTLLTLVKVKKHPPEPSDHVMQNLYVTSAFVLEDWPDFAEQVIDYRVFAGYAGWAQGQLQAEVEQGGWQLRKAEMEKVFPAAGE